MNTEHANPALFKALSDAQGEVENADKSSVNPHFKSRYADLAAVLNTVRPVFAKHGLSMVQSTAFDGQLVNVTTVIGHAEGGHVSSVASCVPAKVDAQGIGAATTYLRRYSLSAMCGIAQEDDDGQAAAHDARPAAVEDVSGWLARIAAADAPQLAALADEIRASTLSEAAKKRVRSAYSARMAAIKSAA